MKDAVQTSILSTKWKQFWMTITSLYFNDGLLFYHEQGVNNLGSPLIQSAKFTSFVNRMLLLCTHSRLHRFRLDCGRRYGAALINAWVCAALSRDVQEIVLRYLAKGLVCCHLTFSLAETWSRRQRSNGSAIHLVQGLPSVQSLCLSHKSLKDLGWKFLPNLLTHMPKLETLVIKGYVRYDDADAEEEVVFFFRSSGIEFQHHPPASHFTSRRTLKV